MPKLRRIQLRIQCVYCILRRIDIGLFRRRRHRQDILLLRHPQHFECLGVTLLDCREQSPAEALYLRGVLLGFVDEVSKAIGRHIAAGGALDIVERKPRRGRLNQHQRVNRRREQRELSQRAGDVHAMSNLVKPVLNEVPIR